MKIAMHIQFLVISIFRVLLKYILVLSEIEASPAHLKYFHDSKMHIQSK
jgi:hypothetical protein